AEQIPCRAAVRRHDDDAGRMSKLLRPIVPGVAKSRRVRDLCDRRLRTGQKMPTGRGARMFVAFELLRFLGGRLLWRFARIESDEHDLEILSGVERQH